MGYKTSYVSNNKRRNVYYCYLRQCKYNFYNSKNVREQKYMGVF